MAATALYPPLQEPDKFGTLILCRQLMDELQSNHLKSCSKSIIDMLSPKQIKTMFFVGLNRIKNEIKYPQLTLIKQSIHQSLEQQKKEMIKKKNKQNPSQTDNKTDCKQNNENNQNVSLSFIIPKAIIINHICHFLDILSIYKLSKCDRKLAIICHTPASIISLQFNYLNPYKYYSTHGYCLDDQHLLQNNDIHAIRNVEKLSIVLDETLIVCVDKIKKLTQIKQLTMYQDESHPLYPDDIPLNNNNWPVMPLLTNIVFAGTDQLFFLLLFLKKQRLNSLKSNVESISFIDCCFASLPQEEENYSIVLKDEYKEYPYLLEFLLPSKATNLKELKFERSLLTKTDKPEFDEIHKRFCNIDVIAASLSGLRGLVYSEFVEEDYCLMSRQTVNLFELVAKNILNNLSLFNELQSIHIHSHYKQNILGELLLNTHINILSKMKEICLSINISKEGTKLLNYIKSTELLNINKLCLVVDIPENKINANDMNAFVTMLEAIFYSLHSKLKLFQITFKINEKNSKERCILKLKETACILEHISNIFGNACMSIHCERYRQQSLTFKLHIKSTYGAYFHNNLFGILKIFSVNYLTLFPIGKLQIKFTFNKKGGNYHLMRLVPLNALFDVQHTIYDYYKEPKSCLHNSMDHKKEVISIQQKCDNKAIQINPKWLTDCEYCDNTPWL